MGLNPKWIKYGFVDAGFVDREYKGVGVTS